MPSWTYFQPFVVSGLALGGVYALSGVGLVVLYRATGVVYLAFGAVGAMGALIAWSLIKDTGVPGWVGWLVCVLFAGAVTLAYGMVFGQARSAHQGGGHPRADARPVRGDGSAVDQRRWAIPRDRAADRQRRVRGRPATGELDAGHRAGGRHRDHGGDRSVPALHQARDGDAGDGQRPRHHRDARGARPAGRGGGLARLRGDVAVVGHR